MGVVRKTRDMLGVALSKVDSMLNGKGASAKDEASVSKRFGLEGLTRGALKIIRDTFGKAFDAATQTLNSDGANISIGELRPGAAAQANLMTGQIVLSPKMLDTRTVPPGQLAETLAHEFTHTGAKTADNHYLNPDGTKRPNLNGDLDPKSINNADTYAKLVTDLNS